MEIEESIYKLIPEPQEPPKRLVYKAKLTGELDKPVPKKAAATMGPLQTSKPSPSQFLKKGEKTQVRQPTSTSAVEKRDKTENRKPEVPKRAEKPVMGQVSQKNFVSANVQEAATVAPKKVENEKLDYLKKPDFGKVPNYLDKRKEEIEDEKRIKKEEEEKALMAGSQQYRLLTEEEREEMLKGLNENWEKINNVYRQLPVTINTLAQKQRKEEYEKQLAEIERDIARLSKKQVYVALTE